MVSRDLEGLQQDVAALKLLVAGNASIPIAPLRVVAFKPQIPGVFLTATTTYTRSESRMYFVTGGVGCRDIRIILSNFAVVGGTGEVNGPNAITWEAVLELNSPSVAFRITFGGLNTITLQPGACVLSDPVAVDLPANSQGWIRSGLTVASAGMQWYVGYGLSGPGEVAFESTAVVSQIFGTGALSNPSGGTGGNGGQGPIAILGVPTTAAPSIQIWGDSIPDGSGDNFDANGNIGFVQRGLWNGGNVIPHSKHTKPGDQIIQAAALATGRYRRLVSQYANNYIIGLGSNDVGTGATASAIEAGLLALVTSLRRRGKSSIFGITITTRTTSTDSWATAANQTINGGFGVGGIADQVNAWMLANVGTVFDAVIDNRPLAQDSSNKWTTNGTANWSTVDGTHPSPRVHLLWAPLIAAIIPQLIST